MFRLIKEGICDKSSVPSVSAISRLLRGRDEDEVKKSSKCFSVPEPKFYEQDNLFVSGNL